VTLADDTETILVAADTMYDDLVREGYRLAGVAAAVTVEAVRPEPPTPRPTISLGASGVTSVIWATGYDFDYDWLQAPVMDPRGEPAQHRGVTDAAGLYFLGLHWMNTFKSGTFFGIGDDADHVSDHLAEFVRGSRGAGLGPTL
jgi:putative flavoprotein involved in K+ transport